MWEPAAVLCAGPFAHHLHQLPVQRANRPLRMSETFFRLVPVNAICIDLGHKQTPNYRKRPTPSSVGMIGVRFEASTTCDPVSKSRPAKKQFRNTSETHGTGRPLTLDLLRRRAKPLCAKG